MMTPTPDPLVTRVRSRLFDAIRIAEERANKQFFDQQARTGPVQDDSQRAALIRSTIATVRQSLTRLREAGLGPKSYKREAHRLIDWWLQEVQRNPIFADVTTSKRGWVRTTLQRILRQMHRDVERDAQASEMTPQAKAQKAIADTISNLFKSSPTLKLLDFALNLMGKTSATARLDQKLAGMLGKIGFGGALARAMGLSGPLTTLNIDELEQQQEQARTAKEARATQWEGMRNIQSEAVTAPKTSPTAFATTSPIPTRASKGATGKSGKTSARGGGFGDTDMVVEAIFMVYDSLEKTIYPAIDKMYQFMVEKRTDDEDAAEAAKVESRLTAEAAPTKPLLMPGARGLRASRKDATSLLDPKKETKGPFAGLGDTIVNLTEKFLEYRFLGGFTKSILSPILGRFGIGAATEAAAGATAGEGLLAGETALGGAAMLGEGALTGVALPAAAVIAALGALGYGSYKAYEWYKKQSTTEPTTTPLESIGKSYSDKQTLNNIAKSIPTSTMKDSSSVQGRKTYVRQQLLAAGYSAEQTQGIMKNLESENPAFDPNLGGDKGTSIGIAQWHNERKNAVLAYQQGRDPLQAQTEYLIRELAQPPYNLAPNQMASSANEAAQQVLKRFERPLKAARDIRSLQYARELGATPSLTTSALPAVSRNAAPVAQAAANQNTKAQTAVVTVMNGGSTQQINNVTNNNFAPSNPYNPSTSLDAIQSINAVPGNRPIR